MEDWWQKNFPQGRKTLTITDASGKSVSIAYGEKGTGKPLFLIHGIGSWSYNWHGCIAPLSQHFHVICFDAKGHGFSDKPTYPEELGHQVIELKRIIRALCDEPAVVVAQSLGALIALAAAEEDPELVDRLIVINVPIFPEKLPHWGMRLLADLPIELVQLVDRMRLPRLFAPLIWVMVGIGRRDVVAEGAQITPEEVYWVSYPYIEFSQTLTKITEDLQHAAQEIQCLLQNQPSLIRKIQEKLFKIQCPTLILWGEEDTWFSVNNAYKLQTYMPDAQLKIIPNCGHDAAGSCAHEVVSAVLSFLHDTHYIDLEKSS